MGISIGCRPNPPCCPSPHRLTWPSCLTHGRTRINAICGGSSQINSLPQRALLYLPWQILFYLVVASIAGIAVSLCTRPVDRERLDRFYQLTRTPIEPGEAVDEACRLPEGVVARPRRMLMTALGLEIPAPSRVSVYGFVAVWTLVALMIGSFVLIAGT